MAKPTAGPHTPTASERAEMHARYRKGGAERRLAPHVVYSEASCPHPGCDFPLQAMDFRLRDHGRDILDPLVTTWWNDTGFAGRCPGCGGWIHFTILGKRAINAQEAARLPNLPNDWHQHATIL